MTAFDYTMIAILGVSMALGVWRGLVYEVLSLAGWPIAFVMSRMFSADAVPLMPFAEETLRLAAAYAAVFVASLIVWSILVWLFSKLVRAIGLGWLDSVLGAVFGVVRAGLVALVLVWLGGLTAIPEQPFWRDARTSAGAEEIALKTKGWLPDQFAQRIHYRNRH